MSPRKSSTSSGRPRRPRFRYLGVEVAGEPLPLPSSSTWAALLQDALARAGLAPTAFRLVRHEGRSAIVRVDRPAAGPARRAWNSDNAPSGAPGLRTVRTWGTLVGAKRWLRGRTAGGADERRRT